MDAVMWFSQVPLGRNKKPRIGERFMLIGFRTNLNWTRKSETYEPEMFNDLVPQGHLFTAFAQDFFACSKNMWDWNLFPEFVVGRVVYDNYLVHHAIEHFPVINVIDGTFYWVGNAGCEQKAIRVTKFCDRDTTSWVKREEIFGKVLFNLVGYKKWKSISAFSTR
jgi:hypothetical protein